MIKPTFTIYYGDDLLAEGILDGPVVMVQKPLPETALVSFDLSPKEPEVEYCIYIGDLRLREIFPRKYRQTQYWDEKRYLDSARGVVTITLKSRSDQESPWSQRLQINVVVIPSKISEEKFNVMFDDLVRLSSGLVFDLMSLGKLGTYQQRDNIFKGSISIRSAQMELKLLKQVWFKFSIAIRYISMQPETSIRMKNVIRSCYGTENLSPNEVLRLTNQGIDPKNPLTPRPYSAERQIAAPSLDTPEHRMLRSFVMLLAERIHDCSKRAVEEIASIKKDKPYRDHVFSDQELSLYEIYDAPKIDRLEDAQDTAEQMLDQIKKTLQIKPLNCTQGFADQLKATPIFKNISSYHAIWNVMMEYLLSSAVLIDAGAEERNKQTWRMYEQWVFLQLASGLRAIGLQCISEKEFVRQLARDRFTIDLQRDTTLSFLSIDNRRIVLRYEPWIFSKSIAEANGDSLYHGIGRELAWSPDVLLEVFEEKGAGKEELVYAVIIDAKYAKKINENYHWDNVLKYQEIKSILTDKQIVYQVWLAYPGDDNIHCPDETITWSIDGPTCGCTDFLRGELGLQPDTALQGGDSIDSVKIFIEGLLNMLNFPESKVSVRKQLEL